MAGPLAKKKLSAENALEGMVKGRKFAAEDIRYGQLYEKWTV